MTAISKLTAWLVSFSRWLWVVPFYALGYTLGIVLAAIRLAIAAIKSGYIDGSRL